jgi:hypothetical protein
VTQGVGPEFKLQYQKKKKFIVNHRGKVFFQDPHSVNEHMKYKHITIAKKIFFGCSPPEINVTDVFIAIFVAFSVRWVTL